MKNVFLLAIWLSLALTLSGQSKCGYIDHAVILKALPEYNIIENELHVLRKQLQDSLDQQLRSYEHFLMTGLPHNVELDSFQIAKAEDLIRAMEQEIEEFQRHAYTAMINKKEAFETALKVMISEEVTQYRLAKGLNFITDKDSTLYYSECIDYTEDFMCYLENKE